MTQSDHITSHDTVTAHACAVSRDLSPAVSRDLCIGVPQNHT